MQESILLAIALPLLKAGGYFDGYCLAISDAGEYFVGNFLTFIECWRIFCWLLSWHW